jgi:ABC-type transport system substrate-binding protein
MEAVAGELVRWDVVPQPAVDDTDDEVDDDEEPADEPRDGGIWRMALHGDPSTSVITAPGALVDILVFKTMYNNLVKYELVDGAIELVPDLCESWEVNEDVTELTFVLRDDVTWHDGEPFSADDVVFTWEFCRDPASAAYTVGSYQNINVVKVDDYAVRVEFPEPMPFWADAFVGVLGMILPKHQFGEYIGATSRDAPANLKPVGTGPYKIVDFKPGDIIIAERNTDYHVPNQPFFDRVEVKGGGDAVYDAPAILRLIDTTRQAQRADPSATVLHLRAEAARRWGAAGRGPQIRLNKKSPVEFKPGGGV